MFWSCQPAPAALPPPRSPLPAWSSPSASRLADALDRHLDDEASAHGAGPSVRPAHRPGGLRLLAAAHSCSADLGCLGARSSSSTASAHSRRMTRVGRLETGIDEDRADQRLDHVAEHIVAVEGAVVARLLAEPHVLGNADVARDLGADRARDEHVQALRQLALGLVGKRSRTATSAMARPSTRSPRNSSRS